MVTAISHKKLTGVVKSFKIFGRGPDIFFKPGPRIKKPGDFDGIIYITVLEIEVDDQIRNCMVLMRMETEALRGSIVEFTVTNEVKSWFIITGVTNIETGVVYDNY